MSKENNNFIRPSTEINPSDIADIVRGSSHKNLLGLASGFGILTGNQESLSDRQQQVLKGKILSAAKGMGILLPEDPQHVNPEKKVRSDIMPEGVVFSDLTQTFRSSIPTIKDHLRKSSSIKAVSLSNFEDMIMPTHGPVILALELCPLYKPGTLEASQLESNPVDENSILNSRVGKKWIATQHTVSVISDFLEQQGRTLSVQATFGDMGVLAAKQEDANTNALDQHSALYEKLFSEFCERKNIELRYRRLSQIMTNGHNVPSFLIAEGSNTTDTAYSIDDFKDMLNLPNLPTARNIDRKRAQVLKYALSNLGGNVDVFRGFVNTYLHGIPQAAQGANLHLGMERAEWILALQTIQRHSADKKIPAINVLVS